MTRTPLALLGAALVFVGAAATDSSGWGSSRSFNGFAHGGSGEEGGGYHGSGGYSWSHSSTGYHDGGYGHTNNHYYYYGDPYNYYGDFGGGWCSAMVDQQTIHDAPPLPHEPRDPYPNSGVYIGPSVAQPSANPSGPRPTATALTVGVETASLPPGATSETVNGAQYFRSGPNWYQMRSSAVGSTFVVVPAP